MIEITKTEVWGMDAAIRGMRNPMNSWDRSDSHMCDSESCTGCVYENSDFCPGLDTAESFMVVGENDMTLMRKLRDAGPVHSKYLRMIHVQCDVNAPMYWWKEFDTYKVGTVRNSCSTMHKITSKEFTSEDFSIEHLEVLEDEGLPFDFADPFDYLVYALNIARKMYLKTNNKKYWQQMIQLLPSSYNQKSTIDLNYQTLRNIYEWRRNHKLDEWLEFCEWIKTLPYSELITGGFDDSE